MTIFRHLGLHQDIRNNTKNSQTEKEGRREAVQNPPPRSHLRSTTTLFSLSVGLLFSWEFNSMYIYG